MARTKMTVISLGSLAAAASAAAIQLDRSLDGCSIVIVGAGGGAFVATPQIHVGYEGTLWMVAKDMNGSLISIADNLKNVFNLAGSYPYMRFSLSAWTSGTVTAFLIMPPTF